jgi:hypothetical protein
MYKIYLTKNNYEEIESNDIIDFESLNRISKYLSINNLNQSAFNFTINNEQYTKLVKKILFEAKQFEFWLNECEININNTAEFEFWLDIRIKFGNKVVLNIQECYSCDSKITNGFFDSIKIKSFFSGKDISLAKFCLEHIDNTFISDQNIKVIDIPDYILDFKSESCFPVDHFSRKDIRNKYSQYNNFTAKLINT